MTLDVQDYVLVVTSTATALTAFAGVVLPLWSSSSQRRKQFNQEKYDTLSNTLISVIELMEGALDAVETSRRALVLSENNPSAVLVENEDQASLVKYKRDIRVARLMAVDIGLKADDFVKYAKEYLASAASFSLVGGELELDGTWREQLQKQKEKSELLENEAAKLLSDAKAILKL